MAEERVLSVQCIHTTAEAKTPSSAFDRLETVSLSSFRFRYLFFFSCSDILYDRVGNVSPRPHSPLRSCVQQRQ